MPIWVKLQTTFRVRAVAGIMNAGLEDLGLLNEKNILDKNKFQTEMARIGKENVIKNKREHQRLESIDFNGRKDNTLKNIVKEEHYVIVGKATEGHYLDHNSPDGGSVLEITDDQLNFITESNSKETRGNFMRRNGS